jgi:hypothetical protein
MLDLRPGRGSRVGIQKTETKGVAFGREREKARSNNFTPDTYFLTGESISGELGGEI